MIDDPLPTPDDPLARAEEALRRVPVPDGPTSAALSRTLAAIEVAASPPSPSPRRRLMVTTLKIAGVALAATTLFYLAAPPRASATSPFTEAAQKLHDAQTLSFRLTMQTTGDPVSSMRVRYRVPGLIRNDTDPAGGPSSILNLISGKVLILNPAVKTATLLEGQGIAGPGGRRDPVASTIDDLRGLASKEGTPIGEKVIGGSMARGFRVREREQDLAVWVDPKTRRPLLIETKGTFGGKDFTGTFADIRLDEPFDDALFAFDAPAGYTLQKSGVTLRMTPEEAVARFLRMYTTASGGRFPAKVDDMNDFQKTVSANRPKEPSQRDIFEVALAAGTLGVFAQEHKGRFGYKPEGVKLGDAGSPVFWYKPEGSARYRVVFGDLHVGDLDADKVPEIPKP